MAKQGKKVEDSVSERGKGRRKRGKVLVADSPPVPLRAAPPRTTRGRATRRSLEPAHQWK
ncbi:MAG: hypothetical protein D6679_04960 [Candidatus Hydrogenedentota bacterium]|nr:MAG: hypothetical protein D6679_04960 [Candidatus Hydrogenedentota bacterium]